MASRIVRTLPALGFALCLVAGSGMTAGTLAAMAERAESPAKLARPHSGATSRLTPQRRQQIENGFRPKPTLSQEAFGYHKLEQAGRLDSAEHDGPHHLDLHHHSDCPNPLKPSCECKDAVYALAHRECQRPLSSAPHQ